MAKKPKFKKQKQCCTKFSKDFKNELYILKKKRSLKKKKQLTNTRSSSSDEALRLIPPKILTLEESLEFLGDDELLEVTPQNIRIRKTILDPELRAKAKHRQKQALEK